jgi:hypothetical protein
VCDLIHQRDALQKEVADLREVMGLFSDLRNLMHDDAPALYHVASNGHMPPPSGHTSPDDPAALLVDHASPCDAVIAFYPMDDANPDDDPDASPRDDQAKDAGDVTMPAPQAANLDDAQAENAGAMPAPATLLARIVDLIEQSARPKRPWQIRKELELPRLPCAELSRLVGAGRLIRIKNACYGFPGRDYNSTNSAEDDAL